MTRALESGLWGHTPLWHLTGPAVRKAETGRVGALLEVPNPETVLVPVLLARTFSCRTSRWLLVDTSGTPLTFRFFAYETEVTEWRLSCRINGESAGKRTK